MRVYVAAPYAAREQVVAAALLLEERGHHCTSSWRDGSREIHSGTIGTAPDLTLGTVAGHALADLTDVASSHALIHLTAAHVAAGQPIPTDWLHTGGRHVEVGYALALGLPVIVVGEPENVFQRGLCRIVTTLEDAIRSLDLPKGPTA